MATKINVSELNLHREPQIGEDEAQAARVTLAGLAERHGAVDELPELLAMLGLS